MTNLNRALKMALKYRWSLVSSLICSVFVAALWCANLGAVYPFVEVVLHNKSLHVWAAEQKKVSSDTILKNEQRVLDIEFRELKNAKPQQVDQLKTEIIGLQAETEVHRKRLARTAWLLPYIRKYTPDDPFRTLVLLIAFMFLGTVFRGLFLMGNMVAVARVGQRTILDIQDRVFANVLKMEVSELGVKGTGDLVSRIRGETNAIGQSITTLFGKTVREPLKMIACLGGAAIVNWRLLLFSLIVCPVAGYLMVWLARMTKRANRRAMEESARLMNRLYQSVTYLRIVKAFTMEREEKNRFKTVARDVYKKAMRISVYTSLARINNELLGVSMISLSVLAGGYLVLNGQTHIGPIQLAATVMDFGDVMVFFAFLVGTADPLRKMGDVYNKIQSGIVAADRVFPLIDQVPAINEPSIAVEIPEDKLGIRIKDVKFSYEPGKPILDGISFDVPAGSSLAIIGHNGCGKSTMINLIPRFFDPESGSIEIGGNDIRKYSIDSLRKQIGYVTQLTMLFNETIGGNIGYGRPGASDEEIAEAAKKAYAYDFIVDLDEGFDSNIGEHGGKLSGGQRQRLSLARAILKCPKILILDEATSQIDPESETLIHQTLREFIKNRTTIVITHRLSTLELVDRIMVMKDGQIVDIGTHTQLIGRCPDYRRLRQIDLEGAA